MSTAGGHAIVTGAAGFIGSHLVDRLLAEGWRVSAIDNFDPFYPKEVKERNIAAHRAARGYTLVEGDILDDAALGTLFAGAGPGSVVVHIAAKAGVRPSILDPIGYHRVNVTGTLKLLERARATGVGHFILASSSSVYGEDPAVPWSESRPALAPISPYAATKLAAEQFAQVYAHLHGMKVTVLRLFTVYGPRQRPDLAIHRFMRNIAEGRPIQRFGDGGTRRDYTFVGDIIAGMWGAIHRVKGAPFEVYNLGNSDTVMLRDLIAAIERTVGRSAIIDQRPEQPGDVPQTYADVSKAGRDLGFEPATQLADGLVKFHAWLSGPEGGMAP